MVSVSQITEEYSEEISKSPSKIFIIKEKLDDFLFWLSPYLYRWFKLNIKPLFRGMPEVRRHIKCNYNHSDIYIDTKRLSWAFDDYMLYDIIPGVCKSLKEQGVVYFDEERTKILDALISMCDEYKALDEGDCPIINEYEQRNITKTENGISYEIKAIEGKEKEYEQRKQERLDWYGNANEKKDKIRKDVFVLLSDNIQRMWR